MIPFHFTASQGRRHGSVTGWIQESDSFFAFAVAERF
jgi:hypothetical protein